MTRYMPQFKRVNGEWQDCFSGFGVVDRAAAFEYLDAAMAFSDTDTRVVERVITERAVERE